MFPVSHSRIALGRIALALALSMWAPHASSSRIAAHINDETIPTAAVDAVSIEQAQRIRSRLMEETKQALEDLIDLRLGIDETSEASRLQRRDEIYRAQQVQITLPQPEALENPLPPDQLVAVVAGDPIRARDLERAAALQLYRLRGELYLQRRRDLDRLIERRLLQFEAQRRGVSLESLEESFSKAEAITDAEVDDFVSRERAAGRAVEDPERVRPYLAFQKHYQRRASVLQAMRAETRISIDLRPPERPHLPVDARGALAFGATEGQILVAYTNYTCPLCRTTHRELDRLLAAARPARIVLRDFVLDPISLQAAALVRCAARNARADPLRRYLLQRDPPRAGEDWFGAQELESIARIAGMKPLALRSCIDAPEIRNQIEQDTKTAIRLGFDKPPAFVAAGVPLSGMQSAEQLEKTLSGKTDPAMLGAH